MKLLFYCLYSGSAFEHKHCELMQIYNVLRAFPMSTNANEHVLLALDSDRTGRDDVEIGWGGGQSACSCRFIRVKHVQRMLYSML